MSSVRSILKDIAATDHWLLGPLFANSKVYGQTVLAAFFVNLLGLISSFFIMTVYDRVIPNNAMESLIALTVGVLFAHLFDFVLKSLRGYFIDVAGQRLDASVGAKVFDNLMSMRLDARKGGVGATAGLVKEFENLRDFFSSATLTAIVDLRLHRHDRPDRRADRDRPLHRRRFCARDRAHHAAAHPAQHQRGDEGRSCQAFRADRNPVGS